MERFSQIAKVTLLALSVSVASGCSTISDVYGSIEKEVEDNRFENRINRSQEYIVEARLLLNEGQAVKAKEMLDKAYQLYPRQASLHDTYKAYYDALGNERLAHLAMARYNKMVGQSNALNEKGRYAMTQMDALTLAGNLFKLSIIYHDENTSTLVNIATLGYTTGDYELAKSSLRMLNRLGHLSPEASMIDFLIAEAEGNDDHMRIVRMIMRNSWPNSSQTKFIETGVITGQIHSS